MIPDDRLQIDKNIQEFKKRRNRLLLVLIAFLIVFLTTLWIGNTPIQMPFVLIRLIFAACVWIFAYWNWRCPACDRYLGNGLNPKPCPR